MVERIQRKNSTGFFKNHRTMSELQNIRNLIGNGPSPRSKREVYTRSCHKKYRFACLPEEDKFKIVFATISDRKSMENQPKVNQGRPGKPKGGTSTPFGCDLGR